MVWEMRTHYARQMDRMERAHNTFVAQGTMLIYAKCTKNFNNNNRMTATTSLCVTNPRTNVHNTIARGTIK